MGFLHQRVQLLFCRHSGDVLFGIFGMDHIHKGADPHHKKFIQIGSGNAQKFQSFK